MLKFLRRFWSWIQQRFLSPSPRVDTAVTEPKPQLSNADYESCLFALIEKVEAGGNRAAVQALLIQRRISSQQLADWLASFSKGWLGEAETHQLLAGQLQQLGEVAASPLGTAARQVWQQLQPKPLEQIINQTKTVLNMQNAEETVAIIEHYVQQHPKEALAQDKLGCLLSNLGRDSEAIDYFDQVIALQPNYARPWNGRGISLEKLGRDSEAIDSFEQAIALQPDYAKAWDNRSKSLYRRNRYEQAIESYNQVLALQPDNAEAWNNRGVSLYKLNRYKQAMESYNQAIIIEPDFVEAWIRIGILFTDNMCQYEKGIECFDQALMLQPNDTNAWRNRGVALSKLGRHEQAIESYDQAITLRLNDTEAWINRGLSAYKIPNNYFRAYLTPSKFVTSIQLSLARSKSRLLANWQPSDSNILVPALNQSVVDSAKHLRGSPPQLSPIPSGMPKFQQLSQQRTNLEALQTLLRQPISTAFIQRLEQDEKKHPHHAHTNLNQRGYLGAIASYRAPLDKFIRKDTHSGDWAQLHQAIGKAHLKEAKQRRHPRSLWQQAENSFKTALSAPDLVNESPAFYLNLLESLINLCVMLGEQQTAQELQRQGRDAIIRLLNEDSFSTTQKQSFAFSASRFEQLSVDSLIQQQQLDEALSTAETGKRLCLRWLLQLDEVPPVDFSLLQLQPHQAAIYWHLSPSRITTFLLLPGEASPRLIPPGSDPSDERPDWLQQQLAWETWLKHWNDDYQDYSRLNKGTSQEHHPWRQAMSNRLGHLSDLLNIDVIKTELNASGIRELLLIPHRDLHRFPLHGLFADYICHYLPNLPMRPPVNSEDPPPLTPLLIVENPKHQVSVPAKGLKGLAELPFAELEADCLRQLISPQPSHTLTEMNATKAQLEADLTGDYRTLHFSGHGIYDSSIPAQSCLFLSGNDRFTLLDIVQQDLSQFELVTLAACETAITGSETITDEYIGLVSAFLSAGARYVLSTLWRVESEASMVLIVEFYRNLNQKMTPAAALNQAQSFLAHATRQALHTWFTEALTLVIDPVMQVLLRERQEAFAQLGPEHPFSHPYYWSPFTLTGL